MKLSLSLVASLALISACTSSSPRPPATSAASSGPRQPSSDAVVAHLRTASVSAPANLVCGTDRTLGAFVSRMIDKKGVPPETSCEKGRAGWHCMATFTACAADPASGAADEPRVWIEFDTDDSGALVGTDINCGEGAEELGEG